MKNVAFFVVMLVLAGVSFSLANVSTCSVLNVTGETYAVNTSLSGAPIPASTGNACLVISADDIILDCQGNTISHDDSADTEAIIVNATASPLNNVTIRNCRIRDYSSGIFVESPSGGRNAVTLSNNSISSNAYGVRIPGDFADAIMAGNTIANNTVAGYMMDSYFGGAINMDRDRFLGNAADINYTAGMSGFTMGITDVIFGEAGGAYGANTSVTHSSSSRSWGMLDWVISPPAPNANLVSFLNKSVNITPDYIDLNGDKLFTVTMKWTDSEGGSALQESGIQMWLINDSGNNLLNGSPDMSGNEISASVYLNDSINSSVFALYRKTGCPVITSPGIYVMDGDMSGAPNGGSNGRDACVLIDSDDVVFDCAGYSITHDDSGNSAGIMVNGTGGNRGNITIGNCDIRDYDAGILIDSTSSARQTVNIANNTLSSNSYGVSVPLGYAYVYMQDNLVANSTTDGFLDSSYFGDVINMSRDRFYGNGNDVDYPSGGSSLYIEIADVVFGDADGTFGANASVSHATSSMTWGIIDWVPAPPPPSLATESFLNKSFNITHDRMDQEKLFDISMKWLPSESAPIDESTIELWMINGSGSFLLNSTPDTSANTITSSLNLTAVSPSTVIGLYYTPSGTNITSCKLINVPGEYNVTSDLTGSTIPMLPGNHTACIWINVSDVHLDCLGHSLTGNTTHDGANHTFGIVASNSSNPGIHNITISNCVISNYTTGMYASVINSSITNNTALNNTHPNYFSTDTMGFGFHISAQDSNISFNNGSYNNASMYLHTQFSRISDNSGYGSYNHGFLLEELENVTLANNTVCGSAREGFFFIGDTFNNEMRNNTLCNNGQASGRSGFGVGTSVNVFFNNIVDGNHIYGNGANGIHFSAEVGWIDKNDNVFSNNLVHGNNESGIYYYSDGTANYNNSFVNNTLYSNMGQTEGADFFSTTYNTTINTTFFNTTSISMSYFDNLFINATNGPGPVPPGYASFHGKYVQIENYTTSPPTVAEIKFHYSDVEASGVDEGSLRIMEYSGGTWMMLDNQSVDESGNYALASNVSSFNSTFGLFLPSCATPADDYLVNASTTFCPGTYYINDSGSPGIIIANSNNTNITCDNTVIIGNGGGSGFNLTRKSNTLVSGCTIVNYYNGIDLTASSSNTVSNNTILNTTNAVFVRPILANSYYNVIENNTIGGATSGIYLYDFSTYQVGYTNITGNVIENCTNAGIFLEMRGYFSNTLMAYNRISGNSISNCTNSVRMYAGDNGLAYNQFNVFENNVFRNGTYGVYLDVQDSRHSLSYNNFSSNAFSDFSSGYAVFFADNLVYANDFGGSNTFNGYSFYHYANRQDQSVSGLDLDSNNDATNLGMFTIANSDNISVSDSNITGDREFGVYLWSNSQGSILGSDISGNGLGADEANVFVFNESGSSISDNVIASAYNGVFLNASTGMRVINNTVRNATLAAVSIYGTSSSNVSGNALTNATYAVFVRPTAANSYYNTIGNNTLGGTTTGIRLYDFSAYQVGYNNITGNVIENCSSYGVLLEARASSSNFMGYNRVAGNNISNCTNSVRMYAGDNGLAYNQFNVFENNVLRNAIYGVYLDVQDSRHTISYNNFTANIINATLYPLFMGDIYISPNSFSGNVFINENASNFIYNPGANATYSNVTFVRNTGSINFPESGILLTKSVNTSNTALGTDVASINSTALPELAIPANVTSYAPQCPAVIYYRTGFPLTSAQVISGGSVCTGPQCAPVSCANNSATFSVEDFSGYTANVTNCMVINASGTYTMAMNFSGAPYDASPFVGYACIKIASSDVAFDCQGYSITGTDNSTPTFGIAINGSSGTPLTNITIRNCPVSNFTYGIYGEYSDLVTIINATAYGHNETGIYLAYSSNASLANDTAYSNRRGFEVLASDSNVSNGTAYGNADHGFYSLGDVRYGSSAAYSNGGTGFRTEGSGAVIANCTAYLNAGRGIAIVGSSNATVTGCAAWSNSGDGFYEEYHGSSVLSDNTAFGNGGSGFNLTGGNGVVLSSNRMYNNTYDFRTGTGSFNMTSNLFLNPSGSLANYTNLSINDSVGSGESYYAVWSAIPAALPAGEGTFESKYLNITVMSGAPSIDSTVWHWLDSELANHTESRLALWKYNSSGWSNAGAQINAASNSLNVSNLNPASTYAILEQLCTVPTSDYLVNASTTFCPGTYYLNDTGSSGVIIANANSVNITCDGTVIVGNGAGIGIYLGYRSGVVLQGCTVSNYGTGILLYDSSSNTLNNNTIINSTRGVQLHSRWGTQSNIVQNNTISGGSSGVYFTSDANYPGDLSSNDVSYNAIRNSGAGIDIVPTYQLQSQAQFNAFRFNNITNCTRAISVAPASGYCDISYNTFSGNILRNGQYGVYFDEYYGRNWEVYRNNFTNNTMFNFSQYAAYFNNDETYGNHFACNNTLDGHMFCHYAYSANVVDSDLDLNASNDVTNLGIYSIVRSTNVTLANSTLRDDRHFGAFLWDNSGSRIMNVTMLDNGDTGDESNVYMNSEDNSLVSNSAMNGSSHGVIMFSSSGNRVNSSTVANSSAEAIYLYESSSNVINNDSVSGSGSASIRLHSRFGNANSNIIQNNTITGGAAGVRFTSDANYPGDLSNNDVSFNRISNSADGIHIFPTYEVQSQTQFNTFRSNNITNCTRAITLNTTTGYCDVSYNIFRDNILRDGQYGVYFDEYYSRNWEVYANNFTNNTMFNFSQYAAYFNNDETYGNHFACNNTLDGQMFCHYAYALNAAENGLSLNASNDVTNLGLFSIVRSTNVTLANSTLRDDRHFGAFLWDNSGSRIMNVTMLDNGDTGDESNVYMNSEDNSLVSISTMNGSSHGVIMFSSSGNRINSSSLANPSGEAVYMYESSSNVVNNDTISGSGGASIRLHSRFGNANSNIIQNNTITGGAAGVRFTSDGNYPGDLSGNDISFNAISNSADCIHISPTYEIQSQTEYNAVRFNTLSNCTRALSLSPLSGGNTVRYNLFEDNNISSSSYGVYLGEAAGGGNEITWNNFSRNTANATLYPVYVANTDPLANRFFNTTLINDNASSFIYNPGTAVNFTNTTFSRNLGRINFQQTVSLAKSVDSVNTVLNTDIASINSSSLSELAIPANVTSYAPQCPAVIYYRTGFPLTSAQVISGGSVCTGPQCTPVSCANNSATFSVADFSGYTANVTNCMEINASGAYTMASDFTGAPFNVSPITGYACIKIASNDVVFDCNGYGVSHNGSANTYGIFAGANKTNITIRNCPNITGYYYGIYLHQANDSRIQNVTVQNNTYAGMYVRESSYNLIDGNRFINNTWYGLYMFLNSKGSNVTGNTADGHRNYGLTIANGADNCIVSGNVILNTRGDGLAIVASNNASVIGNLAYNNGISPFLGNGISVGGSNNTVRNNTARNNNRNGISVTGGSNNTFEANFAEQNAQSGFYSDDVAILDAFRNNTVRQNGMDGFTAAGSLNNLFIGNDVSLNNRSGFNLTWGGEGSPSTNNTIQDNEIYSNGASGLHLLDSDRTLVIRNHLYSNSIGLYAGDDLGFGNYLLNVSGLIFDSPPGAYQNFTNLSLNDTVTAFSEYSVRWASEATSPPGRASFGQKFVDISAVTGAVSIDSIAWSWADSELAGYDETRFELWGLDSSWTKVNASLDAPANTISTSGLVPASTYGIFQNNDTAPPSIALGSPPADAITNATSVAFNFTATDDYGAVLNCSIFIDNALNATNTSVLNSTPAEFQVAGFAEGLHSWRVECGDGNGNTGVSGSRNFTIDASGPSSITLNAPPQDFLANATSVTFNFTATDNLSPTMNCSLNLDGGLNTTNASTLNNTATTFTVPAISQGLHAWYVGCTDLAGNTNASAARNFTVDTAAPSVSLDLPPDNATLYSDSGAFNFTATDNLAPALNCTFSLDGSPDQSNASVMNDTLTSFQATGLSAGPHTWTVSCSDGINANESPARSFYVDIQAPAIVLNAPNQSAVLNSSTVAFNFTATDDHSADLNCSIYLDSVLRDGSAFVPSGSPFVFTVSGIADGNHTWFVNCSDGGNSNASEIRAFNVSTAVPTQPDDDDDEDRPLDVTAGTSCNGTIVTVESRGDPVSNVEIRVDGSLIGTTNSSGQEEFGGCGKSVEIRADKPGYSAATETVQLIGCESCEIIPPKPPENLTCDCGEAINGACVPFQCCSDASCGGSERCDIPSGKAGGQCRPITGDCGEAADHAFVPYGYECGAESGCPSCPQGERCQAHACVSNDLTGPQSGFVGENSTVRALEDGAPCALCDVVVTDPLGRNLSGKTNPDGTFTLPLALKGAYTIALLRDGVAVRSLVMNALPKSEPVEPPKTPVVQTEDWSWLLWIVILLALLMVGLVYWRSRKEKEKPQADKAPKK